MEFTVNTKALKNATSLGIIKANISKFFYRSNIVQITTTKDTLKLNIEASGIKTRMTLKGSGDEDAIASIIVDCSVFKSLIDSIDSDVVSLEFVSGGINVHAGTSKFAIPQLLSADDVQLSEPNDAYAGSDSVAIKAENWQFIKDHQMYAISTSANHPVYTNVWVGNNNDVIVGDYDSSLFTYSKRGDFGSTCLLPTSLVNLFTSIPDGSTIIKSDKNYILRVDTDNYSMITEFTPKYEDDEAVGSYQSATILGMLSHPESYATVEVSSIIKFINQTSIVNQSDVNRILDFTIKDGTLTLVNKQSSYSMPVETTDSYNVKFVTDMIKSVLSNFDSDTVNIAPMVRGTTTIGCIFWTDTLTTLLAGQG